MTTGGQMGAFPTLIIQRYGRQFWRKLALFTLLCGCLGSTQAQLVTYDTLPRLDLIRGLLASGVEIVDIRVSCDSVRQIREFDGGPSNLGLSQGLLMSTGHADSAIGPNFRTDMTSGFGLPGYSPLDSLAGQATEDACVIEIDLIPYCDSIGIRYVFGSEEYHEFVDTVGATTVFNDAFAFFINGPGITAPAPGQNVALVPGTNTPVSINTINNGRMTIPGQPALGPCTNCAFFVENVVPNTTVEYDGFTVPLLATSSVIPCQMYTITLAIADGGDDLYDSGVFLEVGGISCFSNQLEITGGNSRTSSEQTVIEDCENIGEFVLVQSNPPNDTTVFYLRVDGTATEGVDYGTLPDSIVFLPGQDTLIIPVSIFSDNVAEGRETIWWIYEDSTVCTGQTVSDTAFLEIIDLPSNLTPLPDTNLCAGSSILVGQSASPNQTYLWAPTPHLSNLTGSFSVFAPPANQQTPDTASLSMRVTVQNLCIYRDTVEVIIHPDRYLQVIGDTVCQGDTTNFVASSNAAPLVSALWSFGDGNISSLLDPRHVYMNAGTYIGQLISVNDHQCIDTASFNVRIDSLPTFTIQLDPVCEGESNSFLGSIASDNTALWSLGDGTDTTALQFDYRYPNAGNYAISLSVSTPAGCSTSGVDTARVLSRPQAVFQTTAVCEGLPNLFQNLSQPATGNTFLWDFGDGGTSTLAEPNHLYSSAGIYSTTLFVTNANGCTDTLRNTVQVLEKPIAAFDVDPVCLGAVSNFIDQSQFSDQLTYRWNLGDGTNSTIASPTHTYQQANTYLVQLIVEAGNGCSDTTTNQVFVLVPPTANFNVSNTCVGQITPFINLTQAGSSTGLTYQWNLGDGTPSTDDNPFHTYSQAGTYTISLAVQDVSGCTDTANRILTVSGLPTAAFRTDSACAGATLTLVDLSTAPVGSQISEYLWSYPGGTAVVPNPTLSINSPGLYVVKLRVETNDGCVDSTTQEVFIYEQKVADFIADTVCADDSTHFQLLGNTTDPSQPGYILDWIWDFGDGNQTGAISNPSHLYTSAGQYEVSVRTFAPQGCEDLITQNVRVYPKPTEPTALDDTVCFAEQAFLRAGIGDFTDGINWYESLTSDTAFQVAGTFVTERLLFPLTYYVQGYNNLGCLSMRIPIRANIHQDGSLALVQSDTLIDRPNAIVTFSVASNIGLSAFNWNFGDGATSKQAEPIHEYAFPGIYAVTLQVEDLNGCEYELSSEVEIKEIITMFVPSGFSPNGDGVNDEFFVSTQLYQAFTIQIFSRQGSLLYASNNADFRWTGLDSEANPVPEGVYTYRIVAVDLNGRETQKIGTITLIR